MLKANRDLMASFRSVTLLNTDSNPTNTEKTKIERQAGGSGKRTVGKKSKFRDVIWDSASR